MDAYEAGRFGPRAGDPAWDVREGLEAGRIGLRPPLPCDGRALVAVERRPGLLPLVDGTFRADIRDGLDSRDGGEFATMIQLERMSPSPFSRCTFFDGRDGLGWSCDM